MQRNILDAKPDAPLRVYAIFFEMVAGDEGARDDVDPKTLLDDPRVTTFWDDGKLAGRWFDEHVTRLGRRKGEPDRVEWDAFILYGPDAVWSAGQPPSHLSWGRPLLEEGKRLRRDLDPVLSELTRE